MTGFQASLFNTFSHRIVCLDSTHKTNHYRFKLLTLVVRDEYHNGRLMAAAYHNGSSIIVTNAHLHLHFSWEQARQVQMGVLQAAIVESCSTHLVSRG